MKNFKKMFSFMDGYKYLYALSILALIISQIFVTLMPIIIQTTIDSILGTKEISSGLINKFVIFLGGAEYIRSNLWIIALIIVATASLRGVFTFLKSYLSSIASENTVKNMRDSMYDHIQRLPYEFHVNAKTGDLLQRSTSDIETIRRFISIQFLEFTSTSFLLIVVLYILFSLNTKMALASLLILPLIFIFSYIFFKKVKKNFSLVDEAEGRLSTRLQESLTGVRVVKAFSRQTYEIEKFDSINDEFRSLLYDLNVNLAEYWGISDFITALQVSIIIVLGSYLAYKGEITIGVFTAVVTYVSMLVHPISLMGRNLTNMGKAFVSLSRIEEILDLPIENFRENNLEPEITGKIDFENVSFSYETSPKILKNISFSINSGDTLAIIGPTGSGKSSLVQLLPRLYDYDSGSIKIDGIELRDIDKHWIRENIGLILQEPFLYAKTIKENIRLTDPSIEDKKVEEAAKISYIHEDILEFDKGYETLVGERGTSLSGGQKQRVAIARTIIKEKPILIFDDSLSAVDTETDISIRSALNSRKNKSTTIIISHRIATASEADLILVLDKGEIIQRGNHKSLINEEGLYKKIYEIQNSLNKLG